MRDSGRYALNLVTDELATYGIEPEIGRSKNRPVAKFEIKGKLFNISIPDGSVDLRAAMNTRSHVRRLCRSHGLLPQSKPEPQPDVPYLSEIDESISTSTDQAPPPTPQPEINTVVNTASVEPVAAEVIPANGATLYLPRGPIIVLTANEDILITRGEKLVIDVAEGRLLQLSEDKLQCLYERQGTTTLRETLQPSPQPVPPAIQPKPPSQHRIDPAEAEQPDLAEPYPAEAEQPPVEMTSPPPEAIPEPSHDEPLGPPAPPEAAPAVQASEFEQQAVEPEPAPIQAPQTAEEPVEPVMESEDSAIESDDPLPAKRARHSRYGIGAQMGRVIVLMRNFHIYDRQSGRRPERVTTADLRSRLAPKDMAALSTIMAKGQIAGLIRKLGPVSKDGPSHYFKLSHQGFDLATKLGDWPFEVVNQRTPTIQKSLDD